MPYGRTTEEASDRIYRFNQAFLHPFAAHPGKSGGVSRDMSEATRDGNVGLLAVCARQDPGAGHATTQGSHTSPPRSVHTPPGSSLTSADLLAAPAGTEMLLRDFLEAMSAVEADLARRWVGAEERSAAFRPE
ncbi:hypothetical protein GCM10010512_48080 [Streptomyces thermoviolaceus subsp. thermoviolaceus]|nr:hypothetical protein GCM10010499_49890 [Streptomyces thermoviolaceus subsp. apingens]GHB11046.1 hypothetical protein GCM10010512_48080 [Streptomyces thermoviolaceus subsp. thermoviolaceus]